MTTTFHPATERGHANFGWLDSRHSFSFGHWYNPEKIHFGALRVLNDDIVKGGAGFGTHPHDNMEIISIPLNGALAHKDSTGTDGIIETGDVQVMSAGSGIQHSEYNASKTDLVNFLQIWIFPNEKNIEPRYDQRRYNEADRLNRWQWVVTGDGSDNSLLIHQDARMALSKIEKGHTLPFNLKSDKHGVYLFVIEGELEINGQVLSKRDALGISDVAAVSVKANSDAKVLAIEVPMSL